MAIPTMAFEVAWPDSPTATSPTYTDLVGSVRAWSVTRGRNHELQRVDSARGGLTIDDPAGNLTPGNAASVYYPNVVPRRKVRISATWSAVTYRIGTLYVRSIVPTPGGHPDKLSTVEVELNDGFLILSDIKLGTPYAEAIYADGPSAYLPLTDPKGSTAAGNRIPLAAASAPLLASKAGPAGSDFGGDTILRYGDPGSSLVLNPASTATRAEILDCSQQFDSFLFYQQFWTFTCWTKIEQTPGGTQYFLRHQSFHGTGINGLAVSLHTDGTVNVSSGSETDFRATSFSIVDNQPHHIAVVYDGSVGSHGAVQLWVDGVQIGTTYTLTANPFPFGEQADSTNTRCCVGGVRFASNAQNGGLRGLLGHVAFWDDALSGGQIAAHYAAGATGSPENENARITFLLDRAGWPVADRAIDPGLANTLLPRDWSEGSNVLELLLAAAEAAGGLLFMSGAGAVVYQNRADRYNATVAATFKASTGTDAELSGFSSSADDTEIGNVLPVARGGQGVTVLEDAASIARYERIEGAAVDRAVTTDDEAINAGQWQLYLTADPPPRVPTATWAAHSSAAALYPLLLGREISDRIVLDELPATVPDGPLSLFIEQITHGSGADMNEYMVSVQLSPAARYDISTWDTGEWGPGGSPALIWGY